MQHFQTTPRVSDSETNHIEKRIARLDYGNNMNNNKLTDHKFQINDFHYCASLL